MEIKIQKIWRGYIIRKKNCTLKDGMNINMLEKCIESYKSTIEFEKMINNSLCNKKIRLSNFPSHISENIVKFVLFKKYKIMPTWDTDKGDLIFSFLKKIIRIEVKGSIDLSNGPPTFGPTENWDFIYFVDGLNNSIKKYKVYEVKLSNISIQWKNMKVNKTQSYEDQCKQGRRPRLTFSEIQKQLGDCCKLIFDGYISELY
tara:strand:+ start:4658 stop:5263 length:606 start_codon:yes stop_codon:yes gene_type:complete